MDWTNWRVWMADKNDILGDLDHLETSLEDTYAIVGKIKEALSEALMENTQLILENDKLRTRLVELEYGENKSTPAMMEIFNDGFHVCHSYYGKKLNTGENCLLCQEVLYR